MGRFLRLIPTDSDIGLSAKRGTVIRENPTRRATYNPAGGGFHQLVENRPDPDAGVGYPSIPTGNVTKLAQSKQAKYLSSYH